MINKNIIVVDDDEAIVDSLELMLDFAGYQIKTFNRSADLFDYLNSGTADLVLLDIWLSGEDGKEICRKLKSNELTQQIPVILISASRELEKSAADAGADGFLAKPFEMDALLKIVEDLST